MLDQKVIFIEQVKRTATVSSFRFQPAQGLDFVAGQFLQVIFDTADPGNKELNKYLSFSCAPGKGYIEVTKRISSSLFSKKLLDLKPNDELLIKAPLGNCIFRQEYRKIGFLIGGIGITPVISIIEYVARMNFDTDICLLYSNRTDEDIAFKDELDGWSADHKNIKVTYTVTGCQPKDNTCLFGAIDAELLKNKICDYKDRQFFIFGPPPMVEGMKNLALQLGVAKERVLTETFVGY